MLELIENLQEENFNGSVLVAQEGKILLISIFGEEELVDADIKEIDLLHHKIVLKKA